MAKNCFEHLGRHPGFYCACGKGVAENMGSDSFKTVTIFIYSLDNSVQFVLNIIAAEWLFVFARKDVIFRGKFFGNTVLQKQKNEL